MTPLIWMLTWLPLTLSAVSELPPAVNLILTPGRVLEWQPGPGTPTGVYYNVTIMNDTGTSWAPVAGCERVHYPLVCDLTGAFYDPRKLHFVRVLTVQKGQASPAVIHPITPLKEAQMDPPQLAVTPCGRNLCVDFYPPTEHRRKIYDTLSYKLKIECNSAETTKQFFKDIQSLRRQILEDLAPGRQYCVSVCILDADDAKASNYSQPVCSTTSGIYAADWWLLALFCALLILGLGIVGILVLTGFICLRISLPVALSCFNRVEAVTVIDPCNLSVISFWNPTTTSSSKKRSDQSSDESDEESETESRDGSRADYLLKGGSSSLSAPLCPEPEPQLSFFSNQISDLSSQSEVTCSKEMHSSAGLNHAKTQKVADSWTVGIKETHEENKVMKDNQDVNLHTLTFGRNEDEDAEEQEEEEEEEHSHLVLVQVEPQCPSASENNISPIQPSQTQDIEDVTTEPVSCSSDEEEDEEQSGYIGRPCSDVLRNL